MARGTNVRMAEAEAGVYSSDAAPPGGPVTGPCIATPDPHCHETKGFVDTQLAFWYCNDFEQT
jgi:hypothetical protein